MSLFPIILPQLKLPRSLSHPGLPAQEWTLLFVSFLCSCWRKWMLFSLFPPPCPLNLPLLSSKLFCSFLAVPVSFSNLQFAPRQKSVYDKGWEKVLKSYWKSWRPMFEKHCFIFPVVYKEVAQVEAVMVPVYRAASISQTFILATPERWQRVGKRELMLALAGNRVLVWKKEKKRKGKCQDLVLHWSETEAFWISSRENMLPEEPAIGVLLWVVEGFRCMFLLFLTRSRHLKPISQLDTPWLLAC